MGKRKRKNEKVLGERFVFGDIPKEKEPIGGVSRIDRKSPQAFKFVKDRFPHLFGDLVSEVISRPRIRLSSRVVQGNGILGQAYERAVCDVLKALSEEDSQTSLEREKERVLGKAWEMIKYQEERIDRWVEFSMSFDCSGTYNPEKVKEMKLTFLRSFKEALARAENKHPIEAMGLGKLALFFVLTCLGVYANLKRTVERLAPPEEEIFGFIEELMKRTPFEKLRGEEVVCSAGFGIYDLKSDRRTIVLTDVLVKEEDRIKVVELKTISSEKRESVRKAVIKGIAQSLFYSWAYSYYLQKPASSLIILPTSEPAEVELPEFTPEESEALLLEFLPKLFGLRNL